MRSCSARVGTSIGAPSATASPTTPTWPPPRPRAWPRPAPPWWASSRSTSTAPAPASGPCTASCWAPGSPSSSTSPAWTASAGARSRSSPCRPRSAAWARSRCGRWPSSPERASAMQRAQGPSGPSPKATGAGNTASEPERPGAKRQERGARVPAPRASAVAIVFVANGLGGPSFLARLPERQSALGLSDAALGLTLVGMAVGAMVASPVVGRLVSRVGSRRVVVVAAAGLGASLWTAGAAPNAPGLFAALAVVGATDAAMDISMNANGAAFEDHSGRSVMHGLHGAWSLGALAAGGIAAAGAATGVPLTVHLALAGGVAAGVSALGYAGFMAGMVAGRFAGDRLTDRFGGAAVLRGGTSLVAMGLLVGIAVNHPAAFAVGLVLAGLRWAFGLVAGVALLMAATAYRIIPAACRPVAVRLADVREP